MSYYKFSIIGGYKAGRYVNQSRSGHYSVTAAQALAARNGYEKPTLSHHTSDLSGHGRGSEEGRYDLATGAKIGCYVDVDDAQDIHEIYDALECAK